jgi:GNAT superfamily N-acetyltransferase
MIVKITKFKSLNSFIKFLEKKYSKHIDFNINHHEIGKTTKEFLHLSKLEVCQEKRRRGVGTQFMLDLCMYADHKRFWIRLTPVPLSEEITQKRLDSFYRKFGFKFMSESKTMHRRPKDECDSALNTKCVVKKDV